MNETRKLELCKNVLRLPKDALRRIYKMIETLPHTKRRDGYLFDLANIPPNIQLRLERLVNDKITVFDDFMVNENRRSEMIWQYQKSMHDSNDKQRSQVQTLEWAHEEDGAQLNGAIEPTEVACVDNLLFPDSEPDEGGESDQSIDDPIPDGGEETDEDAAPDVDARGGTRFHTDMAQQTYDKFLKNELKSHAPKPRRIKSARRGKPRPRVWVVDDT